RHYFPPPEQEDAAQAGADRHPPARQGQSRSSPDDATARTGPHRPPFQAAPAARLPVQLVCPGSHPARPLVPDRRAVLPDMPPEKRPPPYRETPEADDDDATAWLRMPARARH